MRCVVSGCRDQARHCHPALKVILCGWHFWLVESGASVPGQEEPQFPPPDVEEEERRREEP